LRAGSQQVVDEFWDGFCELLECIATYTASIRIRGDFNLYFDDAANPSGSKFLELIAANGLKQHVKPATYCGDHTRDLILTSICQLQFNQPTRRYFQIMQPLSRILVSIY
jgi:hypothetical protein